MNIYKAYYQTSVEDKTKSQYFLASDMTDVLAELRAFEQHTGAAATAIQWLKVEYIGPAARVGNGKAE